MVSVCVVWKKIFIEISKRKTLCPHFMGGVLLSQDYRATRRQFTFFTKPSEIPGAYLIDLESMKG